ncbi:MAG: LptF/LptG family permease [Candidatus Sericytochromatia bacterium]
MLKKLLLKLNCFDLIDRYIFYEFINYFIFSIGLFLAINLSVFVLFGLIDLMVKYGISFSLFFQLIIYSLPEMIFYSIPMSVLLASIISIGRLYKDNEITIIQNSGRSIKRLFVLIFLFICFISIGSIFFNNFIVSKANNNFAKNIFYAQYKNNLPISKNHIIYKEIENNYLKRLFYAKKFDGKTMYRPIVEEFNNDNELINLIIAEKADFNLSQWDFYNGTIYNVSEKKYNSVLNFEKYNFPFLLELKEIASEMKEPKEMSFFELKNYIEKLKKSGQKTGFMETQLYQKITIPLMSIIFFLLSIPISLSKKNKNSGFAFTMSLLFIFSYYLLMFLFTAIGSLDILSPIICAFMPNIIFLFLAKIFNYK